MIVSFRAVSARATSVISAVAIAALIWSTPHAAAQTPAQPGDVGIVEKRVFELPSYTTVGGRTIRNVRVGWEAYGRLNEARDNVIFIPHFFTGTSNAAGRYRADLPPGYWNYFIGAGRPIDTDRFYVISADSLVNVNTKDPNVHTTGPATTNPDTNRPWGMEFPIVTIRDFVNVHKALLDSLGVRRVHAVVGASMGAFQSLEWGAAFPDFVGRIMPVIGIPEADGWGIGRLHLWEQAIRLDPNWNNGDYYGRTEPNAGLGLALQLITLDARHWGWANRTFGRRWAQPNANPLEGWNNRFAVAQTLEAAGTARARTADANHLIYLVRANQLFMTGHRENLEEGLSRIQSRVLFVPAASDLLLAPAGAQRAVDILRSRGRQADLVTIEGEGGHIDGVTDMMKVADAVRRFLTQ
jgi:homoserine O-acetyltransferase